MFPTSELLVRTCLCVFVRKLPVERGRRDRLVRGRGRSDQVWKCKCRSSNFAEVTAHTKPKPMRQAKHLLATVYGLESLASGPRLFAALLRLWREVAPTKRCRKDCLKEQRSRVMGVGGNGLTHVQDASGRRCGKRYAPVICAICESSMRCTSKQQTGSSPSHRAVSLASSSAPVAGEWARRRPALADRLQWSAQDTRESGVGEAQSLAVDV